MLTFLLTLLTFGVIITLHECGHFIFAKLFGVRVNEFSFGMGPRLVGWQGKETEYSIRLLPIGGYVAMEGEDGMEDEEGRPIPPDGRAFCEKPAWQRFIILFAGAAMNIVLGFFILLALASQMDLLGTNVVAKVEEGTAVSEYLQPFDRIVKVNGYSTPNYNDVVFQMIRDQDGVMDLEVIRYGDAEGLQQKSGQRVGLSQVPFTMENETIQLDFVFYGEENNPLRTVSYAAGWTSSVVKQVWYSLMDILTGRFGLKDLSGPVGTAAVIGEASSQGLQTLLLMVAFITINIGVFNLLPIPALDGGRLFFLLIEIIRRKPIPARYEAYVHGAGLVLLLGLIAVVTFNDIAKLITGGI